MFIIYEVSTCFSFIAFPSIHLFHLSLIFLHFADDYLLPAFCVHFISIHRNKRKAQRKRDTEEWTEAILMDADNASI